jgi:hypothetical protein
LEEADQAVATRTAVEPKSQRVVGWVPSALKEPEERMHILTQVDEAGVGVDTWSCFADSLLPWLLVGDICATRADDSLDTFWLCWELAWQNLDRWAFTITTPRLDHWTGFECVGGCS